ncbi:MAG TPA: ATP-binding protein [Anaerolineae bacterium]|nr:ATP-binding protein [Anaerolineae bacterium]
MAGERIIVVEEDPCALGFCTRILQDAGYQVTGVPTGREAVEITQRQRYDLVLTDFTSAAQDGLDTVREIKTIEPSVVGVAMTGPLGVDAALDTLRSGVDDLIVKPFSPRELRRTVSSALEKGDHQRENIRLRALIPLYELSKAFMGLTQLDQLLAEIVEVSCRESGADRASLMLWDEDSQAMTIQAAIGLPDEIVENTVVRLGEGISGRVAEQRRPLVLDSTLPSEEDLRKLMKLDQISSAICVPLIAREELVGVLNLSKLGHNTSSFTAGSLELASVLAGQAAIAIKNARLFEESQRAYQELKRLDELKSDFINVASHELRTPLAILLGYACLLEEQSTEVTQKYTQAIIKSAMRLKQLITDMLNVRALEAGQIELELQPLQVADVAHAVVEELGFMADEKGQSLTANVPGDLPAVWADEGKLHLILSNLVSNAIKFTPQNGRIEIEAADSEDQLTLSVRDTGVGIAPEEFDRLFDRFYQVGGSLRREHPGLGLGLSIAREMVQLHQGKLWLNSELGKGSTFFFTISRHLGPRI